MKVSASCIKCEMQERAEFCIADNNVYEVTCQNGHSWRVVVTQEVHEILFEMGIRAIADGYYREAIFSFASSLERYYEFFIRTINFNEDFDKVWKLISSQSERQLGAYIFTYFSVYNTEPNILPKKFVEFRNKVIHRGYIANEKEAIKFGKKVAEIIIEGCLLLKNTQLGKLMDAKGRRMKRGEKTDAYLGIGTYLDCLGDEEYCYNYRTFEEYLQLYIDNKKNNPASA